jgi:hypothetical protein
MVMRNYASANQIGCPAEFKDGYIAYCNSDKEGSKREDKMNSLNNSINDGE